MAAARLPWRNMIVSGGPGVRLAPGTINRLLQQDLARNLDYGILF